MAIVGNPKRIKIGSNFKIWNSCFINVINGRLEIGNNVLLGAGAIILSGVTISKGAVIAAGAVVNKDVAENDIVGGVPAKGIR